MFSRDGLIYAFGETEVEHLAEAGFIEPFGWEEFRYLSGRLQERVADSDAVEAEQEHVEGPVRFAHVEESARPGLLARVRGWLAPRDKTPRGPGRYQYHEGLGRFVRHDEQGGKLYREAQQ